MFSFVRCESDRGDVCCSIPSSSFPRWLCVLRGLPAHRHPVFSSAHLRRALGVVCVRFWLVGDPQFWF